MARYYDGDTLIEFVKNNTPHINGETTLACVERAIHKAPTADVVPSSEVAKEFTCFVGDPHKVDHCPYLDEIEKAKSEVEKLEQAYNARLAKDIETNADFVKYAKREVAREIFEEIEKETEIGRIMNACAIVSLDAIAELKKKYTEGNDANS